MKGERIPGSMERVAQAALRFFAAPSGTEQILVRTLTLLDWPEVMDLVRNVFMEYVAPDYCEEGIRTFQDFLDSSNMISALTLYGAYDGTTLVGAAATRNQGNHIALFFVNSRFHRRGIGRQLFETVLNHSTSDRITVHSSPFAVEAYRHLGFYDADAEQTQNGIRFLPMEYTK